MPKEQKVFANVIDYDESVHPLVLVSQTEEDGRIHYFFRAEDESTIGLEVVTLEK